MVNLTYFESLLLCIIALLGFVHAYNQIPSELNAWTITNSSAVMRHRDFKVRTNLIEIAKQLNLTQLLHFLEVAGLTDVLDHEGPFTLFAPTNDAFNTRPSYCNNVPVADVMRYHVAKGAYTLSMLKDNGQLNTLLTRRSVRINFYKNNQVVTSSGRQIVKPDNMASNGVLHVLHDVMCALYKGGAALEIERCPAYGTLTKAINATGLYQLIEESDPLTMFAPTDAAFRQLDPKVLDALMKNITALKEVLLYHVVPGVWYVAGLENGQQIKTMQGGKLQVSISGKVLINNATINLPDATVKNGVVHSLDGVLLPPNFNIVTRPKFMPFVRLL